MISYYQWQLPERLSGLAFVGDTCQVVGGELPEALLLRPEGDVPIVNWTCMIHTKDDEKKNQKKIQFNINTNRRRR